LLGQDLSLTATTATAERWLTRLGGSAERVPHIVFALVARLRALELGRARSELAPRARIRTIDGHWLVAHAARLSGSRGDDIAVMIEPASPGELAPMLIHGYGLSAREQEVVEHVLRGESTVQIATALFISAHTPCRITKRQSSTKSGSEVVVSWLPPSRPAQRRSRFDCEDRTSTRPLRSFLRTQSVVASNAAELLNSRRTIRANLAVVAAVPSFLGSSETQPGTTMVAR
jgi:hypothetical protein